MPRKITETLLRQCLEEAVRKGQTCLIIWSGWNAMNNWDKIENLQNPVLLSVPVTILQDSEVNFKEILKMCTNGNYEGPVTFCPSNEVADCFKPNKE